MLHCSMEFYIGPRSSSSIGLKGFAEVAYRGYQQKQQSKQDKQQHSVTFQVSLETDLKIFFRLYSKMA